MEPTEREPELAPEVNDEDLEFKPIVKYTAIGLAVAALIGIEYATYRVGFSNGFNDGVSSEVVSEAVNNAAVENLTHFMQAATADDATLLKAVEDRASSLAWIKNPTIRREAEWTLAVALMNRDLIASAGGMLDELFAAEKSSEVWGRRARLAARAMAAVGKEEEARKYYFHSARIFGNLGKHAEQVAVYSELAELAAASTEGEEKQLNFLQSLMSEAEKVGQPAELLKVNLLAYMGRLHRMLGHSQEAKSCFEKALVEADFSKSPALPGAAVTMGAALMEKGDAKNAARLLRDGVNRLGESPGDAAFLASGLRDLARIEMEAGSVDSALALLYRAEGAAMGRIADSSSYWLCLYDQRGWVNFAAGSHQLAMADFDKALARKDVAEALRAQPLEGAGRCCIALGEAEKAVSYLQQSLALREKYYADDKASLGRVSLLLGEACDLHGKTAEAASAYGRAAELLPDEPGEQSERFKALLSRAYALSQLRDWNAAIQVWDVLRSYAEKGGARAREIAEQFALCQRYGAHLPEDVDEEEEEGSAEKQPEVPAPAET